MRGVGTLLSLYHPLWTNNLLAKQRRAPYGSSRHKTALHDSILRLISDLDELRETLRRSELQFYGLALAEEQLAVADQDGMDRDIEHVDQALLQQRLTEETVA